MMNQDAWTTYPNAPTVGTVICEVSAIPARGTRAFDLGGFPVLLVAGGWGLRAYVNACPHQFLPLDWRAERILSPDDALLRCSNHGWAFCAETGAGLEAAAQGCALDPVPVHLSDGWLIVGPG